MVRTQLLNKEPVSLIFHTKPVINITEGEFFDLCRLNREFRLEKTSEGDILIMAPAGGESSNQNSELNMQLRAWAKQDGSGAAFDSSGGFVLPNGAIRSPDAAWVKRSRLATLTPEQKRKFIPLCPEFVVELCSPSDRLSDVQDKMQEYIDNGAQLGWLLDSQNRRVYVYRPGHPTEQLDNPETLSGDPLLPAFILDLKEIWEASL